jgi:3-dehydroquinate dehydratase I
MICVSIAEPTREKCLEALAGIEFAEIRLDRMTVGEEDVRAIFSSGPRLIATCRPGGLRDQDRLALLRTAIEAKAAYVDVEIEASKDFRKAVLEAAAGAGCRVIVSYHDFVRTPLRPELADIIDRAFAAGADLAKIACLAESERDNARLLGLLDDRRPLAVMGLGRLGAKTRVLASLLGAVFVYASAGEGRETAAGQIPATRLAALIRTMEGV